MSALPERSARRPIRLGFRPLPTFLIVGAAKAGTTSLYEYIRQHPEAFMPEVKEPHYFINGHLIDRDSYSQLFVKGIHKKARGEASTGYLYSPESPEWIRGELGEIKIIVLLGNPADRAFSLYNWMVMEGYEKSPTFEDALRREPERFADEDFRISAPHFFPDYLSYRTGLYCEQVTRYLDTFGRDHVGVWLFEELVRKPCEVCAEVFEFLNIDPRFVPNIGVHNRSRLPWSTSLQFWFRNRAPACLGRRVVGHAMRLNLECGHRAIKPNAVLHSLLERYREDIGRLQKLIGRDLCCWLR
jgi:hypothetical protein